MGTVPTPLDWIANAGNYATAAALEAGVGDPLTFLLDPPGAQVRRTTTASLTAAVGLNIGMDAEDSDNDGMHSTVTNTSRVTCATAGRFLCVGMIPFNSATSGSRDVRFVKNGGTLINGGRSILTTPDSVSVWVGPLEIALSVGDYLELQAISSTTNTTIATNGLFPILRARWVGP